MLVCYKPSRMFLEWLHAQMLLRAFKKSKLSGCRKLLWVYFKWWVHFLGSLLLYVGWIQIQCGGCEPSVARAACSSWNKLQLYDFPMSRAVLAEAVLSNILHYIHHTKHIRQGSAIACRNFLMSVCFHKHKFPQEAHSSRKISDITKIHRNTLLSHMKSKQCLTDICYKPFAKGSASNCWGKRAVCFGVICFTSCVIVPRHTM